jgi:F420-dependent oxidoreductase-like protein
VKVGIHVVSFGWTGGPEKYGPTLAEIGRAAEQAGVDSLSLMDHYLQLGGMLGTAEDPMLEGYTALGFLTASTSSAKLHLLVTGTTYRHPGLLAKIVSTLDVLSGGRAKLGIGAAWYEREHRALGVPFPPITERFERLEETLQIVKQMWSEDNGPFRGRHYDLAETINSPQPLQRPHPPIMIGGGGEMKTLRLVAKYGDVWNMPFNPDGGLPTLTRKLQVLREHCDREGRDFASIERSIMWMGASPTSPDTVAAFTKTMAAVAGLGVADVHLMPFGADPVEFVANVGEHVIPALADL